MCCGLCNYYCTDAESVPTGECSEHPCSVLRNAYIITILVFITIMIIIVIIIIMRAPSNSTLHPITACMSACLTLPSLLYFRQSSARSTDIDQFYQAVRTGRLKLWIEKIKRYTPNVQYENLSEFSQKDLELVSSELKEMKNYIDELMKS